MSNFGLFNFNISKATPTTSTTNANTTSLPVSSVAKTNSSTMESNGIPKESSLNFLKMQKASSEASSNLGSIENTSASGDVNSTAVNIPETAHTGEKQDLINIFEKFNLEKSKNPSEVDLVEEKFEQFKYSKQQASSENTASEKEYHGTTESTILNSSGEHGKSMLETGEKVGTDSHDQLAPIAIEENVARSFNEADKQEKNLKTIDSKKPIGDVSSSNVPDINSMTNQPYIIDDAIHEEDETTRERAAENLQDGSENNSSHENYPLASDLLTMDNNEPVEEMQYEISEKTELTTQHKESRLQRPHALRKDSIVKASKGIVNANEQYQQSHRPFDFQIFLSHLRNKNADPIVRYIRSFLMSFARQASTMSVTQMMKAVKNFKLFIEDKFHVYEPFASMDETDVENSIEGVEKLIMNRLYEFCFPPEAMKKSIIRSSSAMSRDLSDDAAFSVQVEKFSWILGSHLDVDFDSLSEKKKTTSRDNIDYMEYAAKELNKINNYRAPRDKIICILNACKILFNLLRVTDQETNADAFIPLLILVIIKAKTQNIISNLHYIERFRGENWLNHGETSYYLSTMQGAISFIQNIKREDLTIDETHFAAHMEAWNAEVRQRLREELEPSKDGAEITTHPQRKGMLPSNVLMASAEMFTRSISNFIAPSEEASDLMPSEESLQNERNQPNFTEAQVDEVFNQLLEIFPSLDRDIMRDIIVMNKADFEVSLDVCLQLVNDD